MTDEVFPSVVVESERLRLRPFEEADAGDVHAAWQDERFVRTAPVGYQFAGADFETAVRWCATSTEDQRRTGRGVGFAAVPREGGRLVGHVALFAVDWTGGVAEIHYWTAPWARGRGYAAEAARAVARWALTDVGFARIGLRAAVDNPASRHVAEAAGFVFEGVQRSAAPTRAGTRVDLAMYGLVRDDLGAPTRTG